MRLPTRVIAWAIASTLFSMGAEAPADPLEPVRLNAGELKWVTQPNGISRAFLAGDDKKPGVYAYLARLPADTRLQPHWHPDERVVAVISGSVRFGYGEKFDEAGTKELSAGGFWTEPARQPHFTWAKGGEAVIYVVGTGPSGTTPVATGSDKN